MNPGLDYLDPEEGLARPELRALQEERLLAMAPYAYEHSAVTRAVWDEARVHPRDIRSMEDFYERAPFIDQDVLRAYRSRHADPYAGTLCVPVSELGYLGSTSGTTGNPTPLAHTLLGPTETARGRELHMLGARRGDAVAVMLFSFRSGIDLLLERAPSMGITRIFLSHEPAEVPRLFEVARTEAPVLLYLLSTPMAIAIDEYATERGIDVKGAFSCFRAVVYGGEPMGPWVRSLMERWGLQVVGMSAAGDAMPATECLFRSGMHVWEDLVVAEHLVPGTADPAPAGQRGELVVTSIWDRAAPLLRFRTNDIVLFDEDTCACGRAHARIRTLGRTGDQVRVAGVEILPADVGAALEGLVPCRAGLFQLVLGAGPMEELRLRVGYDARGATGPLDVRALSDEVETMVAERLGCPVQVELVANAELLKLGPPHKIPRTVTV